MAVETKLVLFAVYALGMVGVLLLLQRISRTRKRRSGPVNRILRTSGRVPPVGGGTASDNTASDNKAENYD